VGGAIVAVDGGAVGGAELRASRRFVARPHRRKDSRVARKALSATSSGNSTPKTIPAPVRAKKDCLGRARIGMTDADGPGDGADVDELGDCDGTGPDGGSGSSAGADTEARRRNGPTMSPPTAGASRALLRV
jgi:hypothetical protein